MAEKTGGVGLVEVERLEEGDKTEVGELTYLFEAVHCIINAKGDVILACLVLFGEG